MIKKTNCCHDFENSFEKDELHYLVMNFVKYYRQFIFKLEKLSIVTYLHFKTLQA